MSAPPLSAREMVSLAVLALLSEGEQHPYEMLREVRSRQKNFLSGLPHSLYRAVDRLEKDGQIEEAATTRDGRRPERTVYRLTEQGGREFYGRVGQLLSAPSDESTSFAVALSFAGYFPVEAMEHALTARATLLEGSLAELAAVTNLAPAHLNRVAVLEQEYQHAVLRAEYEWIGVVIDDLRTGRLGWDAERARETPGELVHDAGTRASTGPSEVPPPPTELNVAGTHRRRGA